MISKYTSIKRVIGKVLTDNAMSEQDHRISDMIEWIAEALEKIGAFPYFEVKVCGRDGQPVLEIKDFQTKLPMGAHRILQIGYAENPNGPFYPMRYTTGIFDYQPNKNRNEKFSKEVFSENDIVAVVNALYFANEPQTGENSQNKQALEFISNNPEIVAQITGMLGNTASSQLVNAGGSEIQSLDYTYCINGNYIKCNKRFGFLEVAYQAIPIDDAGYPQVPDDPSFIEALYWYCTMKLLYPEWKEGRVREGVYFEAKRSWNYYCKQAYGNALMPNYDEMEAIKNTWLRLVPDLGAHQTFFTRQGEREQVYNQDSPRYNSYYEKVFYK